MEQPIINKQKKKEVEFSSDMISPTNNKKYNAKVMIVSGFNSESNPKNTHLNLLLKFLVAKESRSSLMLIGGPWSASKDGGDPAIHESILIQTAT
jgi:hypothetical protein